MITFHAIGPDGTLENHAAALDETARAVCAVAVDAARTRVYRKPWVAYLVGSNGAMVGACGFKSPPRDNRVEITFHTFAAYEGRGYAAAMVRALIKIARSVRPGVTLVARTVPQECPATRILEKCGFTYIGMVNHPSSGLVWGWHASP
jgi:RimJ/RimL family protein N-acetyltransferase